MLPNTITEYLATPSIDLYADDAVVTDDGKTYRGRDEIRDWLGRAAGEYTYTTELIGTRQVDANTWVAVNHLEGNFPGGTVDLQFTFTLDDDLITRLVIAP
ncbi:nuclear transport factor 2 family protein [Kribbella turkmenica]|uniref:Nuclear transport factor 2 family protein n=1 Tax=Kribbella turkmenica TaxID=2530375 RepID=A0A4R4XFN3_9ACTN|nr:nuclear transport factor 2 family protein [Kribbella turkmenica]TDD29586.1 nuclear transport factor 2 family protein [Kribbella turkmenica]